MGRSLNGLAIFVPDSQAVEKQQGTCPAMRPSVKVFDNILLIKMTDKPFSRPRGQLHTTNAKP
jgi:hypothetical protein